MSFCFRVDVMIEFIHDKSGLKATGFEMYEYVQCQLVLIGLSNDKTGTKTQRI